MVKLKSKAAFMMNAFFCVGILIAGWRTPVWSQTDVPDDLVGMTLDKFRFPAMPDHVRSVAQSIIDQHHRIRPVDRELLVNSGGEIVVASWSVDEALPTGPDRVRWKRSTRVNWVHIRESSNKPWRSFALTIDAAEQYLAPNGKWNTLLGQLYSIPYDSGPSEYFFIENNAMSEHCTIDTRAQGISSMLACDRKIRHKETDFLEVFRLKMLGQLPPDKKQQR